MGDLESEDSSNGINLPDPVYCAGESFTAIKNRDPKLANAWSQLGILIAGLPHTVASHYAAQAAVRYLNNPSSETHEALSEAVSNYVKT